MNQVKNVPLRILIRIEDQIRRRRVERLRELRRLPIDPAMAERAIHRVNLQAVDQVLVGWRHRIVQVRSMPLHRIVERAHRQMTFPIRRLLVGLVGMNPSSASPEPPINSTTMVSTTPKAILLIAEPPRRSQT